MRQYLGHFYGQFGMSLVILIAVDTLSNTAESEKTNNLIDDPDGDVTFCTLTYFSQCLRESFSLGNAINKPQRWSHAEVCVNGRPIL